MAVYYIIASYEASSNLSVWAGIRYGYRAEAFNLSVYVKSRSETGEEWETGSCWVLSACHLIYYDAYFKKAEVRSGHLIIKILLRFWKYDLILGQA